jgi:SAM-dependent methyltransferase
MDYSQIRKLWKSKAERFWWGDPLDVRFYLCKRLGSIHGKNVLDVGCNAGVILSAMPKDNKLYGIDKDADALQIAKSLNKSAIFFKGDFFSMSRAVKKDFFDIIILSHVLPKDNYASDKFPHELLDAIIPYAKEGGKIYLTTPSVERCYNRKTKFINRIYLEHLLEKYSSSYKIRNWCPWNIRINRFLQYIPGIFPLLEYLSRYNLRSISFYAEADLK